MKNQNNNQKNFILMGADGGMVFTITIFFSLIVSVVYSVIIVAYGLADNNEFLNGPIASYLNFVIPALSLAVVVFYTVKRQNLNFSLAVGLKRCDFKYYLLAIAFAFASLFGLGWLNEQFIYFIEKLGLYKEK